MLQTTLKVLCPDVTWGSSVFVSGALEALGNWQVDKAVPLSYLVDKWWMTKLNIPQHGRPLVFNGVDLKVEVFLGSDEELTNSRDGVFLNNQNLGDSNSLRKRSSPPRVQVHRQDRRDCCMGVNEE